MSGKIVVLSGAFDPPHEDQIDMMIDANLYGKVIIVLNTDEWIKKNKVRLFMPFKERKKLLEYIPFIHEIIKAKDKDGTVCESLKEIMPDYFGNGGTRTIENTPETLFCEEAGINMLWNMGGPHRDTPRDILERAFSKYHKNRRNY